MLELVDIATSNVAARKGVWVQTPPGAQEVSCLSCIQQSACCSVSTMFASRQAKQSGTTNSVITALIGLS